MAAAVDTHDVRLNLLAVLHFADVAEQDRLAVLANFDGRVVQRRHLVGNGVRVDVEFLVANLRAACGNQHVLPTQCRMHFEKSIEWKGPRVGIFEMRRHYAQYFRGLEGAKAWRMRLVETDSVDEVHAILDEIIAAEPVLVG